MNICSCHTDLNEVLCDIPFEWRKGIVDALCFTINSFPELTCKMVKKCETLTSLSGFSIQGTTVSISFKNEIGQTITRSVDMATAIDNIGEDLDGDCIPDFPETTLEEKIQAVIDNYCPCCTTTTTTTTSTTTTTTSTSTTTTTTSAFHFFLADQFTCVGSACVQVDTGVAVQVPATFVPDDGFFYEDGDGNLYSLFVQVPNPGGTPVEIDIFSGAASCNSFCPTTTTTTSTTTTTTCCPITDSDIIEAMDINYDANGLCIDAFNTTVTFIGQAAQGTYGPFTITSPGDVGIFSIPGNLTGLFIVDVEETSSDTIGTQLYDISNSLIVPIFYTDTLGNGNSNAFNIVDLDHISFTCGTTTTTTTSTTTTSSTTTTTTTPPLPVVNMSNTSVSGAQITDTTINGVQPTDISFPIAPLGGSDFGTTSSSLNATVIVTVDDVTGSIEVTGSDSVSQCQNVTIAGAYNFPNVVIDNSNPLVIVAQAAVC